MKNKYKKWWICLGLVILGILFSKDKNLYAASATIWFEAPEKEVYVGEEISVQMMVGSDTTLGDFEGSLIYSSSLLEYISGPSCITGENGLLTISDIGASPSWDARNYRMTFRVLQEGTCQFEMTNNPVAYEYDTKNAMSVSSGVLGFTILPAPQESDNARLAAMKISPGNLTPTFESGIFEYSTVVDSDTIKLTVSAVPEDLECKVSVTGNSELKEGNNIVEIHVKAPAGNELIYTIHVAKEALITPSATPIPETEAPEWRFEVYEERGIPKLTGQYFYTVKEKDAQITIPADYTKTSFIMNGVTIWAYTNTEDTDSDFLLLILENEAGETGLYRYDRVEKTVQRYLQEKNVISSTSKSLEEQEFLQDASDLMRYEQTISKLSLALAVAAGICLILLISVIALVIRRRNLDD